MDAGMVTAICTGVAAIIAVASPVVIELLRQRPKRWAEKVMGAAVDAGYLPQTPCRNVPLPKLVSSSESWKLTSRTLGTQAAMSSPLRTGGRCG
jgi:hypothetical protein